MFLSNLLLCSPALVAHPTLIFASRIAAPSEVRTPGSVAIRTFGQPGDPAEERFYSIFNTENPALTSFGLTSGANESPTFSLMVPLLPDGRDGWIVQARNSANVVGTSDINILCCQRSTGQYRHQASTDQFTNSHSGGDIDAPFEDPSGFTRY
ncbi:hypothetical protein DFH09DRAFT_1320125 [Mycena vulgaris]|nr:hypothetical protein DFH09DRAFT_1320125 [Mycena vulgaris]